MVRLFISLHDCIILYSLLALQNRKPDRSSLVKTTPSQGKLTRLATKINQRYKRVYGRGIPASGFPLPSLPVDDEELVFISAHESAFRQALRAIEKTN